MAGEEHVLHRREARQGERYREAQDHDPGDAPAELILGDAHDRLVGGHHALRARGPGDHGAQRFQGGGDEAGPGPDEQEAQRRLDGPAHDLPGALIYGGQPHGGDDADEERGDG